MRQPVFDDPDDSDNTHQQGSFKLSTKALEALKTQLEIHKIAAFLVDFRASIARVDKAAYKLLMSSDWRVFLHSEPGSGQYTDANARIADVLDSVMDPKADNVILLKSSLREADASDRPGILCSGMDMIDEIKALVTDRSLGEVKLAKTAASSVMFKPGATITATRLTGDDMKSRFDVRPPAERAVKNAFLHEILSKYPTSTPQLIKQKEEYERDLYRTEMAPFPGVPPPWTAVTLISYIAVDMAQASTPEIAVTERPGPPKPQLTPTTQCHNCGDFGKHLSMDCPIKCKTCNFNFCPGARYMACAVTFDEKPSECDPPLENGIKKPLFHVLVQRLDAAWKAKHPGQ